MLNQYAYLNGVGCTDALVSLLNDITKLLDNDKNFGTQLILYDFSKAFDMMQHNLLIHKLQEFGLPSTLISLISNYLDERTQCVYLKPHGVRSQITPCDVGVPQGTLLGPTLWLAFVDSLQFREGSVVKYADDTTSFFPLRFDNVDITQKTPLEIQFKPPTTGQELINDCYKWSTENMMMLNASKTKVLNISLKKTLTMIDKYTVTKTNAVKAETDAKLLGVLIDSHLNFGGHVSHVRKAANKKCHGLLMLKRSGIDQNSLVMLYKAQIIPTLTHTAAAWYPYATGNQQEELENSQKLALRIIYPELEHYHERLAAANVSTLSEHLDNVCRKYAQKVKDNSNHVLHHLIPKRPETIRYSRRLSSSDIYLPRTRTVKCDKNVLRNPKYLFS